MFQVFNPLWLWGLTTLMIPVAIHLLSRREGNVLPFGSLRFLKESKTSRFRALRLNEIALLLLRCLMIILLVLYLANFTWYIPSKKNAFFIEPGLESIQQVSQLKDSLLNQNFELLESPLISGEIATQYRALSEKWSSEYGQVVMVTHQYEKNMQGVQTPKPLNLIWIPISEPKEVTFPVFTGTTEEHKQRIGKSNESSTEFQYIEGKTSREKIPDTLYVNIQASPGFKEDKKVFIAALETIQTISPCYIQTTSEQVTSSKGWNIYLGVPPDSVDQIIVFSDSANHKEALIERLDFPRNKQYWKLNQRLTPLVALENDLIHHLLKIFFPSFHSSMPEDVRVLPDPFVWAKSDVQSKIDSVKNEPVDNPWLMISFLLVLITERLLSLKRKQ